MITLSFRTWVCNAAAIFSRSYGAVTRQAEVAGCSRRTVYEHAHLIEQGSEPAAPSSPPAEVPNPDPTPAAVIDEPLRGRLAVTAFAMGISTRQIEDLLRVLLPEEGPDHSTIARWVAEATVTVDLQKRARLSGPRIESRGEIMAIASGCPMERSIAQVFAHLIVWPESDFGWDRWRAYDLLTHVGRISVGYDGIGTVAARVEERYLTGR